jgi:ubiquitin-conjugating enzyme E2 G1
VVVVIFVDQKQVEMQVETILLSIISMLSSPNDESPANIDAAKEWRETKEDFKRKVSRIVRRSQESM